MSTPATQWFESPLGRHVLEREQAYYDRTVTDIFGFNAVQLAFPYADLLRSSRITFRFQAGLHETAQLRTESTQLPLMSQSMDLVVLPHVLEFSVHPHQILREVERVLMPEGHVLISGFNPFSLWGLRRLIGRRSSYPWNGNFIALPRLKDWLALLGFEVTAGGLGCYAPPFAQERWLRRFRFMEPAGDRWWALAGGVYFVLAKKRVHSMRVILPSWNETAAQQLAPAAQKLANYQRGASRPTEIVLRSPVGRR